jgi:NAD(P)-dependent dehydrogenase (short-subunit alcohol dehydrogenase family)
LGLTRALAIEEVRYDITVNAIAPGFIATEMVKAQPHYDLIKERAMNMLANCIRIAAFRCKDASAIGQLIARASSRLTAEPCARRDFAGAAARQSIRHRLAMIQRLTTSGSASFANATSWFRASSCLFARSRRGSTT